ncbi:MAG: DUF167 domain-containing protein [Actinobacteria bacterium]|nr:DUF167 domain-containing protein [Actinomycetota bacterium]
MASTRLRLRVVPGAVNSGVVGRYGDAWKVRVAAAPERGAANAAVVDLVARALGVQPRTVRLVSGFGSRDKIVEVDGLRADETEARMASVERKDA